MKKKGFVSMTLVYSFLTIFLFVMAAIMASQTEKSNYVEFVNNKVNEDIDSLKVKSISITKRMLEDNFVTDGSIFVIGNVANKSVGNGNGLYFLNSVDENNDGKVSRIYFYRGHVDNNFAKIEDMCFRIIRTNEDGNVRMMYIGRGTTNCSSPAMNTADNNNLQTKKFALLSDDNAFVGYMHGKAESQLHEIAALGAGKGKIFSERISDTTKQHSRYEDTHNFYEYDLTKDPSNLSGYRFFYIVDNKVEYMDNQSNAKKLVDAWYEANSAELSSMVTDSSFCTNRVLKSGVGYRAEATDYNIRTVDYSTSPFGCEKEEDRLTLSSFKGGLNPAYNSLEYPVGLATVADILYAGGSFDANNADYYLKTGTAYWTMSPHSYASGANEVIVDANGKITSSIVTGTRNLYPVISIDANTLVKSGKGTSAAPYVLESAIITYTVEYRSNGATDGTMVNSTYKLDESKALRKNTYTKEGYTFKGWSITEGSDVVKYSDEEVVSNLTYSKGAKVVLYAVWQPIS